jgi:hypothetical protein
MVCRESLNPKVQGSIPCASTTCCVRAPLPIYILWFAVLRRVMAVSLTPYFTPYLVSIEAPRTTREGVAAWDTESPARGGISLPH